MPATYLATGLQFAATNLATITEIATDIVALGIGLVVAFEISRQLFRWEPEAKFLAAPNSGCSPRSFLSWPSACMKMWLAIA